MVDTPFSGSVRENGCLHGHAASVVGPERFLLRGLSLVLAARPAKRSGPTGAGWVDCDYLSTGATVARSMAPHPPDASLRASSARWPPRRPKRRLANSR